jgi:hypothetical protein
MSIHGRPRTKLAEGPICRKILFTGLSANTPSNPRSEHETAAASC